MYKFQYSYNSIAYMNEPFRKQANLLLKYGYDAIELVGEPEWYDLREVKACLAETGLKVSSICSIFTLERDLCHPEKKMRQAGLDYAKKITDMAAEVGSHIVIIAPTARTAPVTTAEEEWDLAVNSIREVGEYAKTMGVNLAIEAWNRYETYFLNRIDQCLDLMKAVDLDNTGVHGDMFHMNIEEKDIVDAYRKAGKDLIHTHIADSNRAAPGIGHLEFEPIVKVLKEIDFQGFVCFELLPPVKDPFTYIRQGKASDFIDKYTKSAIDAMKKAEYSAD